ncbi:hypothetical protein QVD17_28977 [Tagetes erecta]|uniref:Uncharacterized protein n=1 Tax=Tagetes erecta TaxID=13708 RepID=A0AAD8NSM6_TARER|nr:hypothetical protein QVD17_28977 [Tagetes erecta]
MTKEERKKAHTYVLTNCAEVTDYVYEFDAVAPQLYPNDSVGSLRDKHFAEWIIMSSDHGRVPSPRISSSRGRGRVPSPGISSSRGHVPSLGDSSSLGRGRGRGRGLLPSPMDSSSRGGGRGKHFETSPGFSGTLGQGYSGGGSHAGQGDHSLGGKVGFHNARYDGSQDEGFGGLRQEFDKHNDRAESVDEESDEEIDDELDADIRSGPSHRDSNTTFTPSGPCQRIPIRRVGKKFGDYKAHRAAKTILEENLEGPWETYKDIPKKEINSMFETFREKKLGREITMKELFLHTHLSKESKRSYWAGYYDESQEGMEFCTARSEEIYVTYCRNMLDKHGKDENQHPVGDFDVWRHSTGEGRELYGIGSSDPLFVVTGKFSLTSGRLPSHVEFQRSQEEFERRVNEQVQQQVSKQVQQKVSEQVQQQVADLERRMQEKMQHQMDLLLSKIQNPP